MKILVTGGAGFIGGNFVHYMVEKYPEDMMEEAEDTVIKTLEQNLKDQLAVDTIKRMNIPKLLENLQQKALEFEEDSKK